MARGSRGETLDVSVIVRGTIYGMTCYSCIGGKEGERALDVDVIARAYLSNGQRDNIYQ